MCDIIQLPSSNSSQSHLPLKKRRFLNQTTTIETGDAPIDFSLPSRERAKLETRCRAGSSSPCSSKSSMISDLEMDEDQRVPTDPKHISGSFSQSVPIDLSMKSRRFHTVSTETNLSLVKELASNQKHISVASSLLFSCFNARRSSNLLGVFSLLDGKSLLPSTSRSYTVKSVQLKALPDHDGSTEDDQKPKDEQSVGYVINPTTGNRCKKNYKNVTVEKRCEANARERTRVQTIAATFDELRGLLPCDSETKLSKLAILRIASKYIQYLAALLDKDYSGKQFSAEKCLRILHETIESESHVKR